MGTGKLYRADNDEFVADIKYQFQDESETNWWGELTLTAYLRISESDRYIIGLEDKRKGNCRLKKRVNRAVSGIPPRYIYHFIGTSLLE